MDVVLIVVAGGLVAVVIARAWRRLVTKTQALSEALGPLSVILALLPRRSPYSASQ